MPDNCLEICNREYEQLMALRLGIADKHLTVFRMPVSRKDRQIRMNRSLMDKVEFDLQRINNIITPEEDQIDQEDCEDEDDRESQDLKGVNNLVWLMGQNCANHVEREQSAEYMAVTEAMMEAILAKGTHGRV
ncbi:hypothetical protein Tco_1560845 [Tanacetum coccineum]